MTDYEINGKDHKVKYDLDNRIIKVNIDNTDVKCRYDALGRRVIRKQKSVTKTALIWWGNSECAEYKHPKNKGKSPWKSKDFDWDNPPNANLTDLHTILHEGGCDNNYTHISGIKKPGTKASPVDPKTLKLFNQKILCCCRKRGIFKK